MRLEDDPFLLRMVASCLTSREQGFWEWITSLKPHGIQQNLHFQRPIWLEMGAKFYQLN